MPVAVVLSSATLVESRVSATVPVKSVASKFVNPAPLPVNAPAKVLAKFVAVSRPGYELTDSHVVEAFDQLPDDALRLVAVPALAISSTDCRERAATGRPIWYLVPDGVVQYVAKRGLYRSVAQGVSA